MEFPECLEQWVAGLEEPDLVELKEWLERQVSSNTTDCGGNVTPELLELVSSRLEVVEGEGE